MLVLPGRVEKILSGLLRKGSEGTRTTRFKSAYAYSRAATWPEHTQMSIFERLIGYIVTPGVLTWMLTTFAGLLTFFLKSFDKRISALEINKADAADLANMQSVLQQLIESQDRRTARMEGLVSNMMSYSEILHQLPRRNSEDISNLASLVRKLADDADRKNRLLKSLTDEN